MMSIARKGSQRGFSLIEMLVVVGVILILAGTIYPALLKAKEWGRAAKCMSNLRQLQVAALNYAEDQVTDEDPVARLPRAVDSWEYNPNTRLWGFHNGWVGWYTWSGYPSKDARTSNPGAGSYSWRGPEGMLCISNGALWQYVQREPAVYLCPTFAQRPVCGQTDAARSYSMSTNLASRVLTSQALKATRSVMFGDDGALLAGQSDSQFGTNEVGRWHGGRGHVIYVDGHTDRW